VEKILFFNQSMGKKYLLYPLNGMGRDPYITPKAIPGYPIEALGMWVLRRENT